MKRSLQLLQVFRCDEEASEIDVTWNKQKGLPVSPSRSPRRSTTPKLAAKPASSRASKGITRVVKRHSSATPVALDDLLPMLLGELLLVFVGFNPGIESSRTQHHYAHPTNLFWKLFNQLGLLRAAAEAQNLCSHPLVTELCVGGKSTASAKDDARLVGVGLGFTDLVLRCTRAAHELSTSEKMANVPRLIKEVRDSGASFMVIVGKGIWETIVRALVPEIRLKDEFLWGLQTDRRVANVFYRQCGRHIQVFVLPSTSGLVALVTYADKLAMWEAVAHSLALPLE